MSISEGTGAPAAVRESRVDWVVSRGARIRVATWCRLGRADRGTIVIFSGRSEFVEKYAETIEDLLARDLAVLAFDWRGQGLSDRVIDHPRKGHVESYEHYLSDAEAVLAHARALDLPRPWIVLGHSMGGHLALRWIHDNPDDFAAAVLTAPMIDFCHPPLPRWLVRLIAQAGCALGLEASYGPAQRDVVPQVCRFEGNPLTSSRPRFERYRAAIASDPRVTLGGVTYGWVRATLRSIAVTAAPDFARAIRLPVLLAIAGRDRVVDNRAALALAARLPDVTTLQLPDAEHEILIETDAVRAAFLAALDRFLARLLERA